MKPKIVKIYSKNNDFQHAEVLKNNRVKRQKNKQFFVEGVRSIKQLIKSDFDIETFLFSSENNNSSWTLEVLNNSKANTHFDLKHELLSELSNKEETSELIAIVNMPKDDLSRINIHKDLLVVVLDRPSSPGNLGTIIRSCDSFHADGIIVTGHAADIYDPHTIQGSVGAFFSVPVIRVESYKQVLAWIDDVKSKIDNVEIIGTSAKTNKDLSSHDFRKPTILLIGNESFGLSQNYKLMCDELVKIPISGSVSSLNVGCATSIFLYEIAKQRKQNNCN